MLQILYSRHHLVRHFAGTELHKNLGGKFAVDVSQNFRIVFEGYDKNDQLSIEKSEIVTAQILNIEDYATS